MSELRRILDLPVIEAAPDLTDEVRVPGGEWSLRPAQSRALHMMREYGGLVGSIAVGGGKTLIGQLAPVILGVDPCKVLVLTTAQLVREARREYETYREHFDVRLPRYVSYSKLSSQDGVDLLASYDPEWIIADEAHCLKNKDAARTKRFLRFMKDHPDVKFAAMSGTLTSRSLHDFAHLATLALGEHSPLPRGYPRLRMWARVLDVNSREPATPADKAQLDHLIAWTQREDVTPRQAFQRRFSTAPGCVLTETSSCDARLTMSALRLEIPESVHLATRTARGAYKLPNGADIADPLRMNAKVRELGQGFYYEWVWPGGIVDKQWLKRRSDIACAVRQYIKRYRGLDTWGLVTSALAQDPSSFPPFLVEAWDLWCEVADRPEPPVRAVWISEYLLDYVRENIAPGRIFWYQHRAVGEQLAEILPTAMSGEDVPPGDCVALSISSHGTGLNLQRFSDNVILCPPSSGAMWEQMLGRTHRAGQLDTVRITVNHTLAEYRGSWATAKEQARYIQETTGAAQKLMHISAQLDILRPHVFSP